MAHWGLSYQEVNLKEGGCLHPACKVAMETYHSKRALQQHERIYSTGLGRGH